MWERAAAARFSALRAAPLAGAGAARSAASRGFFVRAPRPAELLFDVAADHAADHLRRGEVFLRTQLLEHGLLARIDQDGQSRRALFNRDDGGWLHSHWSHIE